MPLYVMYPPVPEAYDEDDEDRDPVYEKEDTFPDYLCLSCEPDGEGGFGFWAGKPVRVGRSREGTKVKPLSPRFVEVLCVWCRDESQPLLQRAKETGGSDGLKREVVAQITKERFEAFKERYEHEGRKVNHFWNSERELWKRLAKEQKNAVDLDD
ncbi:hypothetical protein E4T38_07205 [Aureobasidium subglaciale]|nr:hypothetical protein E4T38_07205 [Aureobasidium subglaciale]KAI5217797.1 hypothetical protein E4T40_07216 [Aureobasidium subglaciale]KAI5220689.1 hypothetical protein E4T41_07370 [Aureobasidium subglaciale]KAI5258374.1 hypothetical protein E4T46_07347 [Aureobasidium subglaciale]